VGKNYEIECAIVELEKELVELKRRKGVENGLKVINIGAADENMGEVVGAEAEENVGEESSGAGAEPSKDSEREEDKEMEQN